MHDQTCSLLQAVHSSASRFFLSCETALPLFGCENLRSGSVTQVPPRYSITALPSPPVHRELQRRHDRERHWLESRVVRVNKFGWTRGAALVCHSSPDHPELAWQPLYPSSLLGHRHRPSSAPSAALVLSLSLLYLLPISLLSSSSISSFSHFALLDTTTDALNLSPSVTALSTPAASVHALHIKATPPQFRPIPRTRSQASRHSAFELVSEISSLRRPSVHRYSPDSAIPALLFR